ncbi:hypothetical protein NDU88_003217 [Pleurodeles waltl]|uniref:Uncharacterized protein n=1 Tax=Pleurodeles waltl TaxID=8319 RepID=A0AAV7SEN6_PLEWA|nr:hypothetical protein NDU88_003217 [Pleurodeles waltl]
MCAPCLKDGAPCHRRSPINIRESHVSLLNWCRWRCPNSDCLREGSGGLDGGVRGPSKADRRWGLRCGRRPACTEVPICWSGDRERPSVPYAARAAYRSPALCFGAWTELSGPRAAWRRCREVRLAGRQHTMDRAALTTLALEAHGSVRSLAGAVNHKIQGGSVKCRGAALLTSWSLSGSRVYGLNESGPGPLALHLSLLRTRLTFNPRRASQSTGHYLSPLWSRLNFTSRGLPLLPYVERLPGRSM